MHPGLYGKSNHDGEVKDARGVQSGLHCDACVQFILCGRRQMIVSVRTSLGPENHRGVTLTPHVEIV